MDWAALVLAALVLVALAPLACGSFAADDSGGPALDGGGDVQTTDVRAIADASDAADSGCVLLVRTTSTTRPRASCGGELSARHPS
jgi:hypothetical protein